DRDSQPAPARQHVPRLSVRTVWLWSRGGAGAAFHAGGTGLVCGLFGHLVSLPDIRGCRDPDVSDRPVLCTGDVLRPVDGLYLVRAPVGKGPALSVPEPAHPSRAREGAGGDNRRDCPRFGRAVLDPGTVSYACGRNCV